MKLRIIFLLSSLCVGSALPAALGQPGPGKNTTAPATEKTTPGKAEVPPFAASMLLVKSDWSKVPAAKELEAELRAAFKDASIPRELLDKLPASGPQIFFAHEVIARYKTEQFAEFAAWLKTK